MFKNFEELTRFGESARDVFYNSTAKAGAAVAITALWIPTFLYAFLPAA
jgi:lipopolysaccharide export LptBFGC system permease protein LptF